MKAMETKAKKKISKDNVLIFFLKTVHCCWF